MGIEDKRFKNMTPLELLEAHNRGEFPPKDDPEDYDPTAFDIDFDPTVQRMRGYAVHGNTPFDVPYISDVANNLFQGGCSNGLVLPPYIDYVMSLYPWERYRMNHDVKGQQYVKMYDSLDQGFEQLEDLAQQVIEWRKSGRVLVHCQAGLNRSALLTARVLMIDDGLTSVEAITLIREQRSPACLCNKAFEDYLLGLDDHTLSDLYPDTENYS